MASYSGIAVTDLEAQAGLAWPDGFYDSPRDVSDTYAMDVVSSGALTAIVETPLQEAEDGILVPAWAEGFYERIYILPELLDVAASVYGDVEFWLWNAFRYVYRDCTEIQLIEGAQFTLTGRAAPFTMPAFGLEYYTLRVNEDSLSQFLGKITWLFTNANNPVIVLDIEKLRLLKDFPREGTLEINEWKTDVVTSYNGREQRRILRQYPRNGFSLAYRIHDENRRREFENDLMAGIGKKWAMPYWIEAVQVTKRPKIGDAALYGDFTNVDIRAADKLIVIEGDHFESVNCGAKYDDRVELAGLLRSDFNGSALVARLVEGYISPSVEGSHFQSLMGLNLSLRLDTMRAIDGYVAPQTYNGFPLLLDEPVFVSDSASSSYLTSMRTTDFGVGVWETAEKFTEPRNVRSYGYTLETREQQYKFRQLLQYLKGAGNAVYIPTFTPDLIPLQDITALTAVVKRCGFKSLFTQEQRKHLILWFGSPRQYECVEVANVVVSGDTEIITFTDTVSQSIDYTDCKISYLPRCRLAGDRVELEWVLNDEVNCLLNMRGVPDV